MSDVAISSVGQAADLGAAGGASADCLFGLITVDNGMIALIDLPNLLNDAAMLAQ